MAHPRLQARQLRFARLGLADTFPAGCAWGLLVGASVHRGVLRLGRVELDAHGPWAKLGLGKVGLRNQTRPTQKNLNGASTWSNNLISVPNFFSCCPVLQPSSIAPSPSI